MRPNNVPNKPLNIDTKRFQKQKKNKNNIHELQKKNLKKFFKKTSRNTFKKTPMKNSPNSSPILLKSLPNTTANCPKPRSQTKKRPRPKRGGPPIPPQILPRQCAFPPQKGCWLPAPHLRPPRALPIMPTAPALYSASRPPPTQLLLTIFS